MVVDVQYLYETKSTEGVGFSESPLWTIEPCYGSMDSTGSNGYAFIYYGKSGLPGTAGSHAGLREIFTNSVRVCVCVDGINCKIITEWCR